MNAFPLEGEHWDSLAVLSTIALIDQELGITVDAGSLESCRSVGELLDVVGRAAATSA